MMITMQNQAFRVSEIFAIVEHFLNEIEDFDEFWRPSRVNSTFTWLVETKICLG